MKKRFEELLPNPELRKLVLIIGGLLTFAVILLIVIVSVHFSDKEAEQEKQKVVNEAEIEQKLVEEQKASVDKWLTAETDAPDFEIGNYTIGGLVNNSFDYMAVTKSDLVEVVGDTMLFRTESGGVYIYHIADQRREALMEGTMFAQLAKDGKGIFYEKQDGAGWSELHYLNFETSEDVFVDSYENNKILKGVIDFGEGTGLYMLSDTNISKNVVKGYDNSGNNEALLGFYQESSTSALVKQDGDNAYLVDKTGVSKWDGKGFAPHEAFAAPQMIGSIDILNGKSAFISFNPANERIVTVNGKSVEFNEQVMNIKYINDDLVGFISEKGLTVYSIKDGAIKNFNDRAWDFYTYQDNVFVETTNFDNTNASLFTSKVKTK